MGCWSHPQVPDTLSISSTSRLGSAISAAKPSESVTYLGRVNHQPEAFLRHTIDSSLFKSANPR